MNLNCILIEDEISWAIKFEMYLEEIGIKILNTCHTVEEANTILKTIKPDFIIADVMIGEQKVFDVFEQNEYLQKIPTIFATLSDLEADFDKANKVDNHIYLVKPFHKLSLQSAIELVCKDILKRQNQPSLSIKGTFNQKVEIGFDKIIYIEQNQHYSKIVTKNQSFTIKKSLNNLLKELNSDFIRIHRGYCVNKKFIQNLKPGLSHLKINDEELPIGTTFKEDVKLYMSEKIKNEL
jgi:two-component system, LytTR family, response regulator LytT